MLKNIFKTFMITVVVFSLPALSKEENLAQSVFLVIFSSSIICAIISSYLKIEKQNRWYSMSPAGVLFFTTILWFIFFPIYVYIFLQTNENKKENNDNEIQQAINTINAYADNQYEKVNYNKIYYSQKILDRYIKESQITGDEKQEILKVISKARKMKKKIEERNSTISCLVFACLIVLYNVADYFIPTTIDNGAIGKMPETVEKLKQQGYEKTLSTYGLEYIKRSNKLLDISAEKISKSHKCNRITNVMLNTQRSTKDNIYILVDCEDNKRFILSEKDIMSKDKPLTIKEKLDNHYFENISFCEYMIKNTLSHPASYNKDNSKSSYIRGNYATIMNIAFTAKNGFGLPLEHVAHCEFDDTGLIDFKIKN